MNQKASLLLLFVALNCSGVVASSEEEIDSIARCLWQKIDDMDKKGELNKEDDFETFLSVYKSFSEGVEHEPEKEKEDVLTATAFGVAFFCVEDIEAIPCGDMEDLISSMVSVYRESYSGIVK